MRLASRPVWLAAAAAVALLAVLPARSVTRPGPAALIQKGLAGAVAAGRLTPDEAAEYGGDLTRARAEVKTLPPLRALVLDTVIGDVAALWRSYTRPRALTLFSTLVVNTEWLAGHRLAGEHPDLIGEDGTVYRFFSDRGYVFHPLANFAKLNSLVSGGDLDGTQQLAAALFARGVPVGGSVVWEYDFPFASGRAPWTSGMAQAVAAQALARAGDLLSDPALLETADKAYASITRLLSPVSPAKPWIALYSFDRAPVLNAQLQAALSLGDYAAISGDPAADALAARLTAAAHALLPRFDTGYWSLYSLRGDESPLDYHDYVIALLRKLAARTGDESWREVADRFQTYETQPPVIRLGAPPPTLYPRPVDGYRDEGPIRFWLSKRSTVTLIVAGKRVTETLGHGENTLYWAPGKAVPGVYHPYLTAVGPAGHRAQLALPPVTVAAAPGPPPVEVTVTAPATLSWRSAAQGTPWLWLRVRLLGATERVLDLGRRGLAGTRHLSLPPGRWHATLLASNSAGKTRSRSLGYLPR
jgi:D-glucuronyl C5-epimerase C-terminus